MLSFHSSMCQTFPQFYLINICIQLLCINILLMTLISLVSFSSFPTLIPDFNKCMPSSGWWGNPVICNLVVRRHSSVNVDPQSLTATRYFVSAISKEDLSCIRQLFSHYSLGYSHGKCIMEKYQVYILIRVLTCFQNHSAMMGKTCQWNVSSRHCT